MDEKFIEAVKQHRSACKDYLSSKSFAALQKLQQTGRVVDSMIKDYES